MFKPAAPQPTPQAQGQGQQQQPATPGNIPDQPISPIQSGPAAAPNGVVPAGSNAAAPKDDSPLAQFSSLWETKPNEVSNLNPAKPLDAAALSQVMAKADFSKAVTPDMLAAITAGGEGAGTAFTQAMNSVVQQAMVQATLINEQLTAKAVQNAIAATEAKIPSLVRDQSSAAFLQDSNPLFSNPAIKPVIDATRTQLMNQFPSDTPSQIAQKLNNYVQAMGEAFNPAAPPPVTPDQVDWNKFLRS